MSSTLVNFVLCSSNYAKYHKNLLARGLNDHVCLLESAACYRGVLVEIIAAKFSDDECTATFHKEIGAA